MRSDITIKRNKYLEVKIGSAKSDLKAGSDLNLDLYVGAFGGGSSSSSNIIEFYNTVSDKELQDVFSIPSGESVVLFYEATILGRAYTDILFYANSSYILESSFRADLHSDFIENRLDTYTAGHVCVKARTSEYQPTTRYKIKVIYSSCNKNKITWYVGGDTTTTSDKRSNARSNYILCSKQESIDKDSSTTQVFSTLADGTYSAFDMLEHNDYIVDNTKSSGVVALTPSDFQTDKLYRFNFETNAKLSITCSKGSLAETELPKGTIVTLTPVYNIKTRTYDWNVDYNDDSDNTSYTKSEIDTMLANVPDDSMLVHKAGNETITGPKIFTSALWCRDAIHLQATFYIEDHLDIAVSGKQVYDYSEALANKVTSISSDSTDVEYPSAKCVWYNLGSLASSFSSQLNSAVSTLQNADTTLSNSISTEATARQEADAKLEAEIQALDFSACEKTANRVTSITSDSDDDHYPTAKSVYSFMQNYVLGIATTSSSNIEISGGYATIKYTNAGYKKLFVRINTDDLIGKLFDVGDVAYESMNSGQEVTIINSTTGDISVRDSYVGTAKTLNKNGTATYVCYGGGWHLIGTFNY